MLASVLNTLLRTIKTVWKTGLRPLDPTFRAITSLQLKSNAAGSAGFVKPIFQLQGQPVFNRLIQRLLAYDSSGAITLLAALFHHRQSVFAPRSYFLPFGGSWSFSSEFPIRKGGASNRFSDADSGVFMRDTRVFYWCSPWINPVCSILRLESVRFRPHRFTVSTRTQHLAGESALVTHYLAPLRTPSLGALALATTPSGIDWCDH